MDLFRIELTAIGEDNEAIETTIEKEGENCEQVVSELEERIDKIVDYWDVDIKRCEKSR